MFKREEEGAANRLGAAPSAFLQLSDEGSIELEERHSLARRVSALVLMGLVLLVAPLFWVNAAQGKIAPKPVAVKHGGNSGPGSGDDDDDHSGPGGGDDDDDSAPTANTAGTSAPNANDTNPGNTGPGASEHGGHHGHGGGDDSNTATNNGHKSNVSNEDSVTNTAQTGTGPNTNTRD